MAQIIEFAGNHPYLVLAFLATLALLIFNEVKLRTRGFNDLSPMDATRLMNHENAVLLDVRAAKEYQEGHIVNSLHVPLEELDAQLKKLEKYKEKKLIAYCRSGARSATACARLRKQGFTAVYNLRGGLLAWQKDNLPLTRN